MWNLLEKCLLHYCSSLHIFCFNAVFIFAEKNEVLSDNERFDLRVVFSFYCNAIDEMYRAFHERVKDITEKIRPIKVTWLHWVVLLSITIINLQDVWNLLT